MTLRLRRILYSTFIVIFFLAAPPLVLYTAGFRYDFKYNRVVETGSLVVKSRPEGATVWLNGEPIKEQTPTIINTILPGEVRLAVSREGYHSWEKTVTIEPRVTTFEDNIRLFAAAEPETLVAGPVVDYWWNAKKDKIAYVNAKNELRLYNTLNGADAFVANLAGRPLRALAWSPHDDQFIMSRGAAANPEHFIIDANAPEQFINLASVTSQKLSDVEWDPATQNTVYALSAGSLYRIPYRIKTTRLVLRGPILRYRPEKNRIVFIEESTSSERTYVSWIAPTEPGTIHRVAERPADSSAHDRFVPTNSHRIAIQNERTNMLTIIDPAIPGTASEPNALTIEAVEYAFWTLNGERLIYAERFALYQRTFTSPLTVLPTRETSRLITRYSEPIREPFLSDDERHVYYALGETLRVSELAQPAEPRSIKLVEGKPAIAHPRLVAAKRSVTFIDANGALQILAVELDEGRPFFFGG